MEREVWRERGRSMGFRGSRIGSNLSTFTNVFNMFFVHLLYLDSWCAFLCLLGAPWMQKRFKRGLRVILLDSKS